MSTPMDRPSDIPTLADRLTRLFDTLLSPDGRRYSDEHVARAVQEAGGPTISPNYVYLLRTGKRDNPTKRHLEALARFFEVSPAYFFDDELSARIHDELELLAIMRDTGVRTVAMRAAELSPRGRSSMLAILSQLRQIEQADAPPPGAGGADDEADDGPSAAVGR